MPHFHPIGDTFVTLLGLVNLALGAALVGNAPGQLAGLVILAGMVLLGIELARIFTALCLLITAAGLDPDPGEEEIDDEETSELIPCPKCDVIPLRKRAA
jgi:hypothetical protein